MPKGGLSANLVGLIFAILMSFGLLVPLLNIQQTIFGTQISMPLWLGELENIICLIGTIIALIGVFLSFAAKEYAISEGLTIFGASVTLTAAFLYLFPRIGGSTNLEILKVPYATYWYYYQGQWQYTILYNNIPVYLSSLQLPLGPIITCISAFIVVIVFLALLAGYWRRR
ncbi:MAG: hypothetical protein KIH08_01410 [Candidatus Freyarchaeota archaeon]|nr:hypothetical protein [Candidatus Jordarchaeia archaeon]MBS7269126.1 hypothetical protein [Candidatus Jordarchaeia archaeon]MBS7279173.1 hypothetical protein [Candidatus Jordarchaeia archaeon]